MAVARRDEQMSEAETWDEQRERLHAMTADSGTWDLSDNDRAAIAAALAQIDRLEAGAASAICVAIRRWEPANAAAHYEPKSEDAAAVLAAIGHIAPEDHEMRMTKVWGAMLRRHHQRVASMEEG
jgi:hypothetical protein